MRRLWSILWETLTRWSDNDGSTLAASISYYAAFSFFPLLLVLISGLGIALQVSAGAQDAQEQLLSVLARNTAPVLADQVRSILAGVQTNAGINGPLGLATLLLGAMGMFAQLDTAFARLWRDLQSEKHGVLAVILDILINRLKAFLVLIGLGIVVMLSFFASIFLTGLQAWADDWHLASWSWQLLQIGMGVVLNVLLFTVLYKAVPKVPIVWLHALCGGTFVACTWEIGRQILAHFVVNRGVTAYGIVGSFIAMMIWVYYASSLILLGAQLVQVLGSGARAAVSATVAAAAGKSDGRRKRRKGR